VRGGVVGEAPLLGAHGLADLLLGELEVAPELHRHALPHHRRRRRRRPRRVHGQRPAPRREEQRGEGVRERAEEAHALEARGPELMEAASIGVRDCWWNLNFGGISVGFSLRGLIELGRGWRGAIGLLPWGKGPRQARHVV